MTKQYTNIELLIMAEPVPTLVSVNDTGSSLIRILLDGEFVEHDSAWTSIDTEKGIGTRYALTEAGDYIIEDNTMKQEEVHGNFTLEWEYKVETY